MKALRAYLMVQEAGREGLTVLPCRDFETLQRKWEEAKRRDPETSALVHVGFSSRPDSAEIGEILRVRPADPRLAFVQLTHEIPVARLIE